MKSLKSIQSIDTQNTFGAILQCDIAPEFADGRGRYRLYLPVFKAIIHVEKRVMLETGDQISGFGANHGR